MKRLLLVAALSVFQTAHAEEDTGDLGYVVGEALTQFYASQEYKEAMASNDTASRKAARNELAGKPTDSPIPASPEEVQKFNAYQEKNLDDFRNYTVPLGRVKDCDMFMVGSKRKLLVICDHSNPSVIDY